MTKNGRRRGGELEGAILDAAWAELVEFGYANTTLESVAKRAETSRPVLARRWATRTLLATAAMARHFQQNPVNVPDMGSVSDELCLLLRHMSNRWRPDLIRVALDLTRDLADAGRTWTDLRAKLTNGELLRSILKRGVDRGEIDPDRLTPRAIELPTDLARNEILMGRGPLSDEVISEIVNDVFLPLVRQTSEGRRANDSSQAEPLQPVSARGRSVGRKKTPLNKADSRSKSL
jgi:AcrR family transcriptional regulator